MTNASEKRAPLGTLRALLSILLAIAVLVAAQTLALLLGEVLLGAGVPGPACNVLTAGIVEEVIFRGVILGGLERRWNREIAVLVPSVLFGLVHRIGASLDLPSTVQLLVAGTIVGILFSLIACESGSIWNSALVHGVWNAALLGGILHIGSAADSASMYNFVLTDAPFLLSGGDFGIEASVLAIAPYLLGILLAAVLLHRKNKEGIA